MYTRSPCATTRLMLGLKFAVVMMRGALDVHDGLHPLRTNDRMPRRLPSSNAYIADPGHQIYSIVIALNSTEIETFVSIARRVASPRRGEACTAPARIATGPRCFERQLGTTLFEAGGAACDLNEAGRTLMPYGRGGPRRP